MAAEASRSSGSADSYIGSLISLTSKSEIRYEGVLFTINTEEASIGLRNVQSFGTEGRRKDGLQIPPIDKVYEYIVFKGSDIKDLQVKSSPTVLTSSIHNDPAIIQSEHSQAPSSTSLPTVTSAAASDVSAQMSQSGFARSPIQSNLPLYQSGGNMSSWGFAAAPLASGSGPMMPMYGQGFYGASSSVQSQQPPLLQPQQGLPMAYPVQQPVHNPILNATLSTGITASQSLDNQRMLLQPPGSESYSVQPSMIQGQSMAVPSDTSTSLLPAKASVQVPLPMSQNLGLPLVSSVSNTLDRKAVNRMANQAKLVSSPMTSYSGMPVHVSAVAGTSISPPLLTPDHFAQPGSAPLSAPQLLQTAHKDVEVVQVSSSVQMLPSAVSVSVSASGVMPNSTESQAPILPLPSIANPEFDRASLHSRYIHRGGHQRNRGSELSNSETRFTEEFDFEAMNEKFKKDEVWGHLGKSKAKLDDIEDSNYDYDDDDDEFAQVEIKPVYKKDDFFDTLSCNSLDNGSRNGRPRFSEQRRLDTETFGEFSRYRGGRGGRGRGRGRYQRGGYYGRGFGYVGRGRGYHSVYRP